MAVRGRGWLLFPLPRVGVRGGVWPKGNGPLIPILTDAAGMPLATHTTPVHGDERAHILPLLDTVPIRTGQGGRPRERLNVLAAHTGDDANALRHRLQMPTRIWEGRKPEGRLINTDIPRYLAERMCAWVQRKYRRVVVRWEHLAACFNAFLAMAIIHM
jgi:hypothetical protein